MTVDGGTILATGHGRPPLAPGAAELAIDVGGRWLTPGFIDLHGHGGGGHSYEDGAEEILAATAAHRRHGTTRSLISFVANPLAELEAQLAVVATLAGADPLILGSHLEGPYLARERRGAHNAEFLREPQPAEIDRLLDAARGTLRQLTLAPELPNALEATRILVENGVTVAVGHTEATLEQAQAAFDEGARLLTHAFNAMPGIHHRAPGPVVAAFDDPRVVLELILDGRHVHPSVAALAFDSAPGRIALVTDATAAAGSVDGDYSLGSVTVAVRDGVAMLRGTTTLAGSTLTQDAALRVAIREAGVSPADAIAALTTVPAGVLGLEHRYGMLAAGFAADAVILDHALTVQAVWADGRPIPRAAT
ncbi:N-acetylglucosamine-6-phosphate deacetylase [Galbitalea soli]|uniref:N-acetylglucosamine-6-phosphate deacetylase n=2 Tax=Galbitalea soli TaxID=1268042 RepID=A0A7C9TTB5_9MICO|nr:N-acetylglucosamine-6-phosphate deacetylase [Galbitalea soli]NEM92244.1 N-acetylglucosamine-6-phosphate deacetylase [Galbitalea soli]